MKVTSQIIVDKLKRIGVNQGRNSEVWLARDEQLAGEVILKEIPLSNFNDPSEFFREAQIIYANKHPRIVPINYACQDSNFIRMVMPYFPKGSLQDQLDIRPLPIGKVIKYAQEFLSGLQFVHINKFIHYDVKPTNIFITDDDSAMLADFGQARPTNNLGVALTPPTYTKHSPPELIGTSTSTKLTDIYHCGLTLYRMCNGNKFFDEQFDKFLSPTGMINVNLLAFSILNGEFPDRSLYLPHVPKKLRKIINKALEINPKHRHQTALELMNDLGKVVSLLDWQYEEVKNGARWFKYTIEHMYEIVLYLNYNDNMWYVQGKTIKIVDNTTRNRSIWSSPKGYKKKNDALKILNKIFNEMD
ncbi:serine/threonine-protein kinase [Paenibacillus oleatilyticus]|uniref:serine/threonine-protein kinase n=1 Tax=Paenibacillus oleatilyticus TaxID=2594886 RepID=UPI001C1F58FC|nr:serine/threonine-protein kinase [Paenibacillus oleatilyticus]MBU7316158.1 serine/threonine protein kinase [Paenibacillus oleatilyticus]